MSLDMQAAQCLLPLLIMAVPIFDTTLVIIIRKREGRAVSQGGRDHSSHRLVYAGLTDKMAVLLLYAVSAIAGVSAVLLGRMHSSAAVFAALVAEVVLLGCMGTYLNRYREPKKAVVRPLGRAVDVENGHRQRVEAAAQNERV
jgi:UDP-GlcNAc:undecaprenyl-phosphate/decaprenyl-phosphate GlcNAc-1-phosphate transferase